MDPERKLIASDAETGEYREGTVLRLSDSTLPAGYRPGFVSAVEVISALGYVYRPVYKTFILRSD